MQGRILQRHSTHITATLVGRNGHTYTAEIDLDRFADADRPSCQPGVALTVDRPGDELQLREIVRGDA